MAKLRKRNEKMNAKYPAHLMYGALHLLKGRWFDIEVLTTTGKSIFSG